VPIPGIPGKKSDYGLKKKQQPKVKITELTGKNRYSLSSEQRGVHLKEMRCGGTLTSIKMHNLCLKKKEGLPSVK